MKKLIHKSKNIFFIFLIFLSINDAFSAYSDFRLKKLFNDLNFCSDPGYSLSLGYLNHKEEYLQKSSFVKISTVTKNEKEVECANIKKGIKVKLLEKDECEARWLIFPDSPDYKDIEYLFLGIHHPPRHKAVFTNFSNLKDLEKAYQSDKWKDLVALRNRIEKNWINLSSKELKKLKLNYKTSFIELKEKWIKEKKVSLSKIQFITFGHAGCH